MKLRRIFTTCFRFRSGRTRNAVSRAEKMVFCVDTEAAQMRLHFGNELHTTVPNHVRDFETQMGPHSKNCCREPQNQRVHCYTGWSKNSTIVRLNFIK